MFRPNLSLTCVECSDGEDRLKEHRSLMAKLCRSEVSGKIHEWEAGQEVL